MRTDTLYAATAGGVGPGIIVALTERLRSLSAAPDALVASAADANVAGERYAADHAELAAVAGIHFTRLAPTTGTDWNDVLKQGRGE